MTTRCVRWPGDASGGEGGGNFRRPGRSHRARYHRFKRDSSWRRHVPLNEYYLWCDHRAKNEAAEITELAHQEKLAAIQWCGGVYSSEWGFAKLLHWLRHNPDKRDKFARAFEHCDMVAATLVRHHRTQRK